tara:strand:- start:8129 stop:8386 length:258 start_codon:yes stop_codon:yes gene_type:complete
MTLTPADEFLYKGKVVTGTYTVYAGSAATRTDPAEPAEVDFEDLSWEGRDPEEGLDDILEKELMDYLWMSLEDRAEAEWAMMEDL